MGNKSTVSPANSGTNERNPIVTMTLTAVTTALVLITTFFASVQLTVQGQVFDAGDIMVFITALTFGPIVGGFAGGVGSGLSDALHGYTVFAPFTLVIKGSEGVVAGYLAHRSLRGKELPLAWLSASVVMVGGYFLAEFYFIGLVFGQSALQGIFPFLDLPFNLLQVFAGGLIGIPVSRTLKRSLPSILFATKPRGLSSSSGKR